MTVSTIDRFKARLHASSAFAIPAIACAMGCALTTNALAQDVPDGTEIVVTAERRSSTVQRTPISISAIGEKEMLARGARSMDDILRDTPGITGRSNGPGNTSYQMRGMSPGAAIGVGGIAGTVGFYLDDVALDSPASGDAGRTMIDPSLFDLSRVEVIRGPQGTLYGSSSMGGTVKLITNLPDTSGVEAAARISGGMNSAGSPSYGGDAMINLPISEKAALRVVGGYRHYGGWIDRVVVSPFPFPTGTQTRGDVAAAPVAKRYKNDNQDETINVRATLLLKPTETLTLTPRIVFGRAVQNGSRAVDSLPGDGKSYRAFDFRPKSTDNTLIASLTGELDLPWASLTSISGYVKRDQKRTTDGSEGLGTSYGLQTPYATDGQGFGLIIPEETGVGKSYSQELRLQSTSEGPFSWLVGAFYSHYKYDDISSVFSDNFPTFTAFGPGYFPTDEFFTFRTINQIEQFSQFVNLSYKIAPTVEIRAGVRHFSYKTKFGLETSGAAYGGMSSSSDVPSSESGFSPSATLSYTPSDDFMAYGTISRGFRPGSGNFPATLVGPVGDICRAGLANIGLTEIPPSYKSDAVTNFEIGEKLRLLDRRLTLNGSLFYLKWSKVQQPVILPGCDQNFVTNTADATIKGVELEVRLVPADGFTLTGALTYTDAKFSESNPAAAIAKGDRLTDTPKWTANTGAEYSHKFGDNSGFVRLNYSYISKRLAPTRLGLLDLPNQSIFDARMGMDFGRYSISLGAANIFDKQYDQGDRGNICCQLPGNFRFISVNQPQTFTLDLLFKL